MDQRLPAVDASASRAGPSSPGEGAAPLRDYVAWHDAYAQPGSPLHRRLEVVIDLIGTALDALPPGPVRFVSMCAGQGHDVLSVASTHRRGSDLRGRLVELEPNNVAAVEARIAELGLADISALAADAGRTDSYADAIPVALVLACGVFGNVSSSDIERTVRALPSLCAPGAWVVWTRHPREPGVLNSIERWFADSGFERHSLVVAPDQTFAVGLHRLVADPVAFEPGQQLFTFIR